MLVTEFIDEKTEEAQVIYISDTQRKDSTAMTQIHVCLTQRALAFLLMNCCSIQNDRPGFGPHSHLI